MTAKQPLIGITMYGRDQENKFSLPADYVDAVRRAGGIPLLIPPGETNLARILAQFDGVILAGGGDIDPAHYDGTPHQAIYRVDAERDSLELPLARLLAESDLPTLCICRGIQALNVALGGSLIEHLPDVVGEQVIHRSPLVDGGSPFSTPAHHPVYIEADSRLSRLMGTVEVDPVSWHHQAIRQVAPGLVVAARAADGTIEAVEKPDHPWLIAVQWHPEMSAQVDSVQQRLFDAFIRGAVERPSRPSLRPQRVESETG